MATKGPPRRSLAERFWPKVEKTETCWLWTGATAPGGYGKINAGGDRGRTLRANRVSWELAHGPIPDGAFVCHGCDVPACVRPEHLFLADHDGNMADLVAKKRGTGDRHRSRTRPDSVLRGTRIKSAKLDEKAVRAIRRRYGVEGGPSMSMLAREYGVNISLIHRVIHRRIWAHVE
jgi:HNH endonuclease